MRNCRSCASPTARCRGVCYWVSALQASTIMQVRSPHSCSLCVPSVPNMRTLVLFLVLKIPQIPIIPRFLFIPILLLAEEEFLRILLGSTGRRMAVTRRVGGAQSITLQFADGTPDAEKSLQSGRGVIVGC
jgi:hypothetical protein